ncbi:CRE-CLEC-184 protein [Caenorhabditis remanei]|uniref:CRE-CLEC-184 protein n=1 Tax=Caenorhabditis remanei TaxID=31234 RepID=E3NQ02_CAERE|nr:CRE-CLEC-184 protein [Caenorhabditis remanei]
MFSSFVFIFCFSQVFCSTDDHVDQFLQNKTFEDVIGLSKKYHRAKYLETQQKLSDASQPSLVLAADGAILPCDANWHQYPDTGCCYRISDEKSDWYGGTNICKALNSDAQMASFHSQAESLFFANKYSSIHAWTGLSQTEVPNTWTYTDGTPDWHWFPALTSAPSAADSSCVEMMDGLLGLLFALSLQKGQTNPYSCTEVNQIICKYCPKETTSSTTTTTTTTTATTTTKTTTKTTTPTTTTKATTKKTTTLPSASVTCTSNCPAQSVNFNGKCYKFQKCRGSVKFEDSCNECGGTMITISNKAEKDFVSRVFGENDGTVSQIWIGNTESNGYLDWEYGQPSKPDNSLDYCISMDLTAVDHVDEFLQNKTFNDILEMSQKFQRAMYLETQQKLSDASQPDLVLAAEGAVLPCEAGWHQYSGTGCCYKKTDAISAWYGGTDLCKALHPEAQMASFHSQGESEFVCKKYSSIHAWTGLSQTGTPGVWTYTDGTPDWHWFFAQSSSMKPESSCVEMLDGVLVYLFSWSAKKGQTQPYSCTEEIASICKYCPKETTSTSTTTTTTTTTSTTTTTPTTTTETTTETATPTTTTTETTITTTTATTTPTTTTEVTTEPTTTTETTTPTTTTTTETTTPTTTTETTTTPTTTSTTTPTTTTETTTTVTTTTPTTTTETATTTETTTTQTTTTPTTPTTTTPTTPTTTTPTTTTTETRPTPTTPTTTTTTTTPTTTITSPTSPTTITALTTSLKPTTCTSICPSPSIEFKGKCYKVKSTKCRGSVKFDESSDWCGGTMVTISNKEENDFISRVFGENDGTVSQIWIGNTESNGYLDWEYGQPSKPNSALDYCISMDLTAGPWRGKYKYLPCESTVVSSITSMNP